MITIGPRQRDLRVFVADPDYWGLGEHLSWSADGGLLAFAASGPFQSDPGGAYGTGWPLLAIARAERRGSRVFPRAFLNGGDPVVSPDGRLVVFSRLKLVKTLPDGEGNLFKVALWSLDVKRGSVRRLTRWRMGGFSEPVSFSPDGASIVTELFDRRGVRLVATDLGSRRSVRLALLPGEAREPTYSLDGTRLAYVLQRDMNPGRLPEKPVSELVVAGADGSGAVPLLRRRGYITSLGWDPSGSQLAFVSNPPAEATGSLEPEPGNKVMAINVDGTCLQEMFSETELTVQAAAWQPGVGREAGPIAC